MLWATGVLLVCAGFAAEPGPPLPPLTTVPGSPRLAGKFVWADLVTDDVAAARRFYGELFNWTFRDVGHYTIAANDERPLAGMFKRERAASRPEAKPRWFGYISTWDVGKAVRTTTKEGGRVLVAPQRIPQRGEQAVLADPEGALFGVVRSTSGDPPDFLAEPGDWIWIQLLSRDAKKGAEFYRKVAGYEVLENRGGPEVGDYVLASKGFARATVRTIPPNHKSVPPNWLPFVRVKNLKETLDRTAQLGGVVRLAPKPELFDGKVAVISDPRGAAIGVMEWNEPPREEGGRK
jgi:predicted enzyme related to lactoylglutathione lyase